MGGNVTVVQQLVVELSGTPWWEQWMGTVNSAILETVVGQGMGTVNSGATVGGGTVQKTVVGQWMGTVNSGATVSGGTVRETVVAQWMGTVNSGATAVL